MEMSDIRPDEPVEDIVRDAIIIALKKNGHDAYGLGPRVIEGEVRDFWFDTQMNFWTVEFMGSVACNVRVIDKTSEDVIYEGEYSGYYDEKSAAGYVNSWERVMNAALDRMIESMVFDTQLVSALEAAGVSGE